MQGRVFMTIKINLCSRINMWECLCHFHISFVFLLPTFFSSQSFGITWFGFLTLPLIWPTSQHRYFKMCSVRTQQFVSAFTIDWNANIHVICSTCASMYCSKFCQYTSRDTQMICVGLKIGVNVAKYMCACALFLASQKWLNHLNIQRWRFRIAEKKK